MRQQKETWSESDADELASPLGDSTGSFKWTCPKLNSFEGATPSKLYLLQSSNFNEYHHQLPGSPRQISGQHSLLLTLPYSPLIHNQVLYDGVFQTSPRVHPLLSPCGTSWSSLPSSLTCSSAIASQLSSCPPDFAYYSPFFSLQLKWPSAKVTTDFCSINLIMSSPSH